MLLFAKLESGVGSLIQSIIIAKPDFFTLFSQHGVILWDHLFYGKWYHVSPIMSWLTEVSTQGLWIVSSVSIASVVLNSVTEPPSSFSNVEEVGALSTLHFVNHVGGQACHVAVDLPGLASYSIGVSCMFSRHLAEFTKSIARLESTIATITFPSR